MVKQKRLKKCALNTDTVLSFFRKVHLSYLKAIWFDVKNIYISFNLKQYQPVENNQLFSKCGK